MERETAGSPYRTMRRLAIEDPEEDELEEGDDAILTLQVLSFGFIIQMLMTMPITQE